MTKYTQKQLRDMAANKIAIDLTSATNKDYDKIIAEGGYTQIGYAQGVYGCNGKLLKGLKNNKLYVITKRTNAVFIF